MGLIGDNSFGGESRRQALIVVGLICTSGLGATVSHNERALFSSTQISLDAPRAFTAVIPPEDITADAPDAPRILKSPLALRRVAELARPKAPLKAFFPEAPAAKIIPSAPNVVDSPVPFVADPVAPAPAADAPIELVSNDAAPSVLGAEEAVPAKTLPGVPEPSTWLMLLMGFFAIGVVMRRRPMAALRTSPNQF
jgi:PEP-CTERM motif